MLALTYYALGLVLLHVYGTHVCPFLQSLSGAKLIAMLAAGFGAGAALKAALAPSFVERAPVARRAYRVLQLELATYVVMGLGVGTFATLAFGFPKESGLKVVLGFFTLGLFASFDVALGRQRGDFRDASPRELSHTVSVTRMLMAGFAISLLLSGVVIVLAVKKDVDYLLITRAPSAGLYVMVDVLFTIGVIGALGLRVLASFARNLSILFDAQLTTLAAVERGQLDRYVPVVTGDEFGVIASRTNRMIDGLREKERVKQVLGKVVSPEVSKRLIAAGAELTGERVDLAILFCDLRDFTTLSERSSPEALVALLNTYFTRMVACIEAERGVVDKFIGDAVLATFGLAGEPSPGAAATRAALAMVASADEMGGLVNGVGVHFGPVVAGTIGSPDRFEYTVIGDAVNAASRLESLCKPLAKRVLVSAEAHAHLPPELAARLAAAGSHTVKGRARPLEVYGFPG